jgi:hypothetical protein
VKVLKRKKKCGASVSIDGIKQELMKLFLFLRYLRKSARNEIKKNTENRKFGVFQKPKAKEV